MKKGSKIIASITSDFWKLMVGDELTALSNPYWFNGEYHIKTNKGVYPTIFFK